MNANLSISFLQAVTTSSCGLKAILGNSSTNHGDKKTTHTTSALSESEIRGREIIVHSEPPHFRPLQYTMYGNSPYFSHQTKFADVFVVLPQLKQKQQLQLLR